MIKWIKVEMYLKQVLPDNIVNTEALENFKTYCALLFDSFEKHGEKGFLVPV